MRTTFRLSMSYFRSEYFFLLLTGFLFFLPFYQKASVICILLMLIFWLVSGDVKKSFTEMKRDKKVVLFLFFFLAHVVGLAYTTNFSFALFDLQTKLSFLFFPLLFCSFKISDERWKKLKWVFVSGCFVAVLLCLFFAFGNYLENQSLSFFYYSRYSHFLHPTYFSFYLNLSVLFLLDELIRTWKTNSFLMKIILIFLIYFFFINIFQLSARTATITAFITCFMFCLFLWKKNYSSLKQIGLLSLFFLSLLMIQQLLLQNLNRFEQVEEAWSHTGNTDLKSDPTIEESNSTNLHFLIWKNSLELIGRDPFCGVGTGDVKDELIKTYEKNNFKIGVASRYNAHNQFLNTTVAIGLMGLISLLLIFYIGIITSLKHRDWIFFSFLVMIFLNSMTESILETQSGILFFASFNMLFYLRNRTKNQELTTKN